MENKEVFVCLLHVSELLEREIEKDKYRPFFRGANGCSLHSNWYGKSSSRNSSLNSSLQSSDSLSRKQSVKRKSSVKTVFNSDEPILVKRSLSRSDTTSENIPVSKHTIRRAIAISDDEDDDDDYHVNQAESKRKSDPPPKQTVRIKATNSLPPPSNPTVKIITPLTISIPLAKQTPSSEITFDSISDPPPPPPASASASVGASVGASIPKIKAKVHVKSSSSSTEEEASLLASSSVTSSLSESKSSSIRSKIESVLQPLISNPDYDLFLEPVPRAIEDYYQIIAKPKCFRDIQNQLRNGKYNSITSFEKDIQLIVVNCIYYNMLYEIQSKNRSLAYSLYKSFIREYFDYSKTWKQQGTIDQHQSLFDCFIQIIEGFYAFFEDGQQLIRYFAVDPKDLDEYNRYVSKPISLFSILVGEQVFY